MAHTTVSASSEMATDAMVVYRELSVVFIFSSTFKDLLGMGVGMTGKASQHVQVPASRGKGKIRIWHGQQLGWKGAQSPYESYHQGDSIFLVSVSHLMKQPILWLETSQY